MQPPGIYNHHRLPPAAAQTGGPPANVPPQASRLMEAFDMIKGEYDNALAEAAGWKAQRDEYESQLNHQIQELTAIRKALYELETQHTKRGQEQEAEIVRLRRENEMLRAAAASNGPMPTDIRGPDGYAPLAPPANGGGGDVGSSRSSYPPPPIQRPLSTGIDRRDSRSVPPQGSPTPLLSDLDPENVSRELKKEGSDWFAIWSPKVKKQLDVSLVHSLGHDTVVCCVKFSNDGKYLATGCNRTAQIYDTKTGAKTCVLLDESAPRTGDLYIRSICFSPDGKFLATGAEDRQIRVSWTTIWDIKQQRIRHLLQGHMQEIYSLDFSRDGRFLVSGSGDKSARVWDIEKGACIFDLRIEDFVHNEHGPIDAGITSVALSPDGKLVAAGSLDTMVRVWNVQTGQQVERLKGHKDSVYSVAFSPDGKSLVSGSLDRTLRVWDLAQTKRAVEHSPAGSKEVEKGLGTCASTLNGHKDYVLSVAISPDGRWVVSGSKDRSIEFWDILSGQAQFMLQGHKNSVISIDLARSGGLLASGSGDCHARIWSYGPP
ncbi:WD40 repeat-like protein [Cutaneotrichosporon oleaginosum]|uniref:WD40 repeat-like protein n=2 Tax=Cutaneotrichosporon oleaginosum TaxID=879819 RepID=A0A0J1ATL9_9TREE|nr:WD40 repeat-like protein [Cutaneotrichosporon oleaginosum]KLT38664.1 WD40 repeat-like protein [Cutaneotrichosporon oleaginosum]